MEAETDSGDEPEELLPPLSPVSDGQAPARPASRGSGPGSARAGRQLAMSCRVRLERLRSLERPDAPLAAPPAEPDSAATEPRARTRSADSHAQETDGTYVCYFCKKHFIEISDLVAHLEKHTGQEPYSCRICYKMFPIETHLMLHSKIHKVKSRSDRLQTDKHITFISDPVTPIDKSLKRRSRLIEHKKVRSEWKPYRCEVCNGLFILSSSLCGVI